MNGEPSIELAGDGQRPNIRFNGRLLYPETLTPEKRLEDIPRKPQTLYIIVSPLLFYGVELLESLITDDSRILAVEQNPEIYRLCYKHFSDGNFKKTRYLLLGETHISEVISDYAALRLRRTVSVKLNHGYMLNRNVYDSFLSQAESLLQTYWKNRITIIHMGRLWCRNIFQNLPFLPASQTLSAVRTQKPVVAAGAGESLEHSMDFLKKYRDNFFLAAADTAVSALLQQGLEPDLVIVLESQHANLYDFFHEKAFSLPTAVDLTSSPELIRKFKGPLYFFISEFDNSSLLQSLKDYGILPPVIPPLGSVGIASIYISSMLTKKDVFYTGLDFSFTADKYHAAGSPTHILNMISEKRTSSSGVFSAAWSDMRKKVTDKSGRKVFTDLVMLSYADTLRDMTKDSGRFFNIADVGIGTAGPPMNEGEITERLLSDKNTNQVKITADAAVDDVSDLNADDVSKKVFTFLEKEIQSLDQAIESVVGFQNSRDENSLLTDDLERQLKKLDYTWLFFPDTELLPSASAGFLKRFLYSASWFRRHLRNTLTFL